jgi:hypothetical protein
VGAIADEQVPINPDALRAQRVHFAHEGEWIEHDAVANYTAAAFAQHSARYELKNELLAVDSDGVPGIVSAGITSYDFEAFRKNVNDFAFAFIAPLSADDNGRLAWFQMAAPPRTGLRGN